MASIIELIEGTAVSVFTNALKIAPSAFCNNKNITAITAPYCREIGSYAFFGCINLSSISIPECRTIGSSAFWSCTKISFLSLPNCRYLAPTALQGCSLNSLYAPRLNALNDRAIYYCTGPYLYSLSFPYVLAIYSSWNFGGCSKLEELHIPKASRIAPFSSNVSKLHSLYIDDLPYVAYLNDQYSSEPLGVNCGIQKISSAHIYVPSSLVSAYQTSTGWSLFASKFIGV